MRFAFEVLVSLQLTDITVLRL